MVQKLLFCDIIGSQERKGVCAMKKQWIIILFITLFTFPFSVYATEEISYRGESDWIMFFLLILYFIVAAWYLRNISKTDK